MLRFTGLRRVGHDWSDLAAAAAYVCIALIAEEGFLISLCSSLELCIGRTDAKAETPILCLPHVKSLFIGKDPDAGRDWGQEEKGTTEDEMAGWHHRLDGYEFE